MVAMIATTAAIAFPRDEKLECVVRGGEGLTYRHASDRASQGIGNEGGRNWIPACTKQNSKNSETHRLITVFCHVCYHKEGPYQDRPPLFPFRLLPLLIYSRSAIAFFKFQGPKSKNIENVILLQP